MIQAGTIKIGSGCTLSVVGQYWISSMSSFLEHHLAGDVATVLPMTKSWSFRPAYRPTAIASRSLSQFCQPNTKFSPPLSERPCPALRDL